MLIIFRKSDGVILDSSGTSSAAPLGHPADDDAAWRLNLRGRGIAFASCGFTRLHDVDDAAVVARTFLELHHVNPATGALVFDGPRPAPPAPPAIDAEPAGQLAILGAVLVEKGILTAADLARIRDRKVRT